MRFLKRRRSKRRRSGEASIGMSGTMKLTKIDRATGKVKSVHKGGNAFLSAGVQAAVSQLAAPAANKAWNSNNLRIRVRGNGITTNVALGGGVSVRTTSSGQIVATWTDNGPATYWASEWARPRLGATELASHAASWGQKAADETWIFEWTVSWSLDGAAGLRWGASNIAQQLLAGRLTGSAYTGTPRVRATNSSSSNPIYSQTLGSVTSAAQGAVWTIRSQRAGSAQSYSLRGEAISLPAADGTYPSLLGWYQRTPLNAGVNETITVEHTFAFVDA